MNKPILTLSFLASVMAAGCEQRRDTTTSLDQPAAASADASSPAAAPAVTSADAGTDAAIPADDGLALGLLASVNEHEIKAADQAIEKKVSGAVLDYARMMKTQHTENQAKTVALGAKQDAPEVQAKKEKGAAERTALAKLSGKEYEAAYKEAMIKGHTEALAMIDDKLLPMASAGPVKDHLTTTRGHVAMHLEAARKL
jgi:putative membrane protein